MKHRISILFVLLLFQIVLACLLIFNEVKDETRAPDIKFVNFLPEDIDLVEISGADHKKAVLIKEEGLWKVDDYFDFPADSERIEKIIHNLSELETGWPVATSSGASLRFRVAQDDFERRIVLSSGNDRKAEIFFGTSTGVRKVHARSAEQYNVYEVKFPLFQAEADPASWIDKDILKIEKSSIVKVGMPGFTLEDVDGKLAPVNMDANETLESSEMEIFMNRLTGISIDQVLGLELPDEFRGKEPDFEYSVVTAPDNREIKSVFFKPEEGPYYVMKSSERPEYFRISSWQVDALKDYKREKFLKPSGS